MRLSEITIKFDTIESFKRFRVDIITSNKN